MTTTGFGVLRHLLWAVLIAGGLLAATAPPAHAVPMPGGCVSTMDRSQYGGSTTAAGYVEGDWEVNTGPGHCGDSMQYKTRCWDRVHAGSLNTVLSGVVVGNEINDRAKCVPPTQYVFSAFYRINGGSWRNFTSCNGCQPGAPAARSGHGAMIVRNHLRPVAHLLAQRSSGVYLISHANGLAVSEFPNHSPQDGDPATMQGSNAWTLCKTNSGTKISLCSNSAFHLTDHHYPGSGDAVEWWQAAPSGGDQTVTYPLDGSSFSVRFSSGHWLCAHDQIGAQLTVGPKSACGTGARLAFDWGTAPAAHAVTLAAAVQSAKRCVSIFGGGVADTSHSFEVQWQTNECGEQIRGLAECQDGRQLVLAKPGGWISAIDLWSRSNCPVNFILKRGGYDWRNCQGCTSVRHWIWGAAPPARKQLALAA